MIKVVLAAVGLSYCPGPLLPTSSLTSPIPASSSWRSVPCQLGGVRSLHLVLFSQRWTSAARCAAGE